MLKKTLALCLVGFALGAPASAPAKPSLPQRGSAQLAESAVRPAPRLVAASRLERAELVTAKRQPLGTIVDLVCDVSRERIAYVILQGRTDRAIAVPWVPLRAGVRPNFLATGYPDPLAQAIPRDRALNGEPGLLDLERGLLGRPVLAADGSAVGSLSDLLIDPQNGDVKKLVVAMPPPAGGSKALDWNAVADLLLERAIVLRLTPRQLAALPDASAPPRAAAAKLSRIGRRPVPKSGA